MTLPQTNIAAVQKINSEISTMASDLGTLRMSVDELRSHFARALQGTDATSVTSLFGRIAFIAVLQEAMTKAATNQHFEGANAARNLATQLDSARNLGSGTNTERGATTLKQTIPMRSDLFESVHVLNVELEKIQTTLRKLDQRIQDQLEAKDKQKQVGSQTTQSSSTTSTQPTYYEAWRAGLTPIAPASASTSASPLSAKRGASGA